MPELFDPEEKKKRCRLPFKPYLDLREGIPDCGWRSSSRVAKIRGDMAFHP
jgi:hypothetical protein